MGLQQKATDRIRIRASASAFKIPAFTNISHTIANVLMRYAPREDYDSIQSENVFLAGDGSIPWHTCRYHPEFPPSLNPNCNKL
jgi:hypothetical protein